MLNILTTREVAREIGKSVRRTQEIIGEGLGLPRLEVRENGRLVALGATPASVRTYKAAQKKR